jgi:hypothetical protein
MKNKLMLLIVSFLFSLNISFGQTASDIELKYGKPTNAYSVSEYIWMTPEYTVDGQVCRMRLYPKRISGNTNYVSGQLPFDDFRRVVDQIVPLDKRGAKREPFYNGWATGGGAMWAIFTYEKVRITYSASFKIDADAWKESKPFVFSEELLSLPEKESKSSEKPEDDFLSYRESKAEIVTITWLDRKCALN